MVRAIFWGVFICINVGMLHIAYYDVRKKWRGLKSK